MSDTVDAKALSEDSWDWSAILTVMVVLYTIHWLYSDWRAQVARDAREKARAELFEKMKLPVRDDWTLEEIAEYNGKDSSKPIVIVVKGKVYNVWRGREFYGEGGSYHCFAGTDATRSLAKELLEPEETSGGLPPLTDYEKMQLQDWIGTYEWKYDVCALWLVMD